MTCQPGVGYMSLVIGCYFQLFDVVCRAFLLSAMILSWKVSLTAFLVNQLIQPDQNPDVLAFYCYWLKHAVFGILGFVLNYGHLSLLTTTSMWVYLRLRPHGFITTTSIKVCLKLHPLYHQNWHQDVSNFSFIFLV